MLQDYLKVVRHPVDLSTIGKNLVLGQYAASQDFVSDMKLIFSNSYAYNRNDPKVSCEGRFETFGL